MGLLAKIMLLLVVSAPAEAARDIRWCLAKYEEYNPFGYALGVGDRVSLTYEDGSERRAVFLGDRNDLQYFFDGESGQVFAMKKGIGIYDSPELSQAIGAASPGKRVQSHISVPCQGKAFTCAVHSTVNGLKILEVLGLLPEATRKQILFEPQKLFEALEKTGINHDVQKKRMEEHPELIDEMKPQNENRVEELKKLGVESEITTNSLKIRNHLLKGLPAILDMAVKKDPRAGFDLVLGPYSEPIRGEGNQPARTAEERTDYHSVVAVAVFDTPGREGHQVLVLDSSTGSIHVWDFNAVVDAIQDHGATLLQPTAPAVPVPQQRRRAA